jgi:hypothetical protein
MKHLSRCIDYMGIDYMEICVMRFYFGMDPDMLIELPYDGEKGHDRGPTVNVYIDEYS